MATLNETNQDRLNQLKFTANWLYAILLLREEGAVCRINAGIDNKDDVVKCNEVISNCICEAHQIYCFAHGIPQESMTATYFKLPTPDNV